MDNTGLTLESGHMQALRQRIGAEALGRFGLSGDGVGVAVIDSGVTDEGFFGDRLVHGPNYTAEGVEDRNGHGTHLAGIAAGMGSGFTGVAPGAHIISLKVADREGATDPAAVIDAIDFCIAHRHELAIGVILLTFNADAWEDVAADPLGRAAARAVEAGLVLVTSAGNGGEDAIPTPGYRSEVLTVGADEAAGERRLADFSNPGNERRRPDVIAPGRSVVSLLAPGSAATVEAPEDSKIGDHFVKATGTSQAAAVVAGAAALLLEAEPCLTPGEVKAVLRASARRIDVEGAGAGAIDLEAALAVLGSGLFELDAYLPVDPNCTPSGLEWHGLEWSGNRWSGNRWSGNRWSGNRWSGNRWSGNRWSGHELG